jgi:hypothetical protein
MFAEIGGKLFEASFLPERKDHLAGGRAGRPVGALELFDGVPYQLESDGALMGLAAIFDGG